MKSVLFHLIALSCLALHSFASDTSRLGYVGLNPVEAGSGNLHREVTDLETFGSAPIEFTRIYRSRAVSLNDPYWLFGAAQTWTHNWNFELRNLRSGPAYRANMKLRYPNGTDYTFECIDQIGMVWAAPTGSGDKLYKWAESGSNNGFTLVRPNGWEYYFSRVSYPTFRMTQVRDPDGMYYYLSYNADGDLLRIINQWGRFIELEYEANASVNDKANANRISAIFCNAGRRVEYTYEAWQSGSEETLARVTYPDTVQAAYTYVGGDTHDANGPDTGRPLLATAVDPMYPGGGSTVRYEYNYEPGWGTGRRNYLTVGMVKAEYNLENNMLIIEFPFGSGTESWSQKGDGSGTYRKYYRGNIVETQNEVGESTFYEYSAGGGGYLIKRTDPSGLITEWTRDVEGRPLSETRAGHTRYFVYNDHGFKISETDELGRTTLYFRNADDLITQITYPDGSYVKRFYNIDNQLTREEDELGNPTRYFYYGEGQVGGYPGDLLAVRDPLGHETTYTHDAAGNTVSRTLPGGETTQYSYNWRGALTEETHPDGASTSMAYDDFGNLADQTDALGYTTSFAYDAFNRKTLEVDPMGGITQYEYGTQPGCNSCTTSSVSKITKPDGSMTAYYYDDAGRRIEVIEGFDTPEQSIQTFAYEPMGRLLSATDALGHATTYEYDILGRRTAVTTPLGFRTEMTYDAIGRTTAQIAPDGGVTAYSYDLRDRRIMVTDPLGGSTQTLYDAAGQIISRIDANGHTTSFSYNARGDRVGTTNAKGDSETVTWTANGMPESMVSAAGINTAYTYDARGRATQVTVEGDSVLYAYDSVGNLLATTDADGKTSSFTYDGLRRKTSEISPDGDTTSYTFDSVGNLVALVDPNGAQTQWAYDALQRKISKTYADGTVHTSNYDAVGNLISELDAKGQLTEFIYDADRRMVQKVLPNQTIALAYDSQDRLISMDDDSGSTLWLYDLAGRPVDYQQSSADRKLTYEYDARGNRTKLAVYRLSSGQLLREENLAYDSTNRPSTIESSLVGSTPFSYAYDADGRLTETLMPNGSRQLRSYNSKGQLASIQAEDASGINFDGHTYQLAPSGQRIAATHSSGRVTQYGYDGKNQVISAVESNTSSPSAWAYGYDPAGNRTNSQKAGITSLYTANLLNQYTAITGGIQATPVYDLNGNLESSGGRLFSWDADDQLVTFADSSNYATYAYDGMGRRISKDVNGELTLFLYDEYLLIEEIDVNSGSSTNYIHGLDIAGSFTMSGGVGSFLARVSSSETALYFQDGNGNITSLQRADIPGDISTYTYDPFGNVVEAVGTIAPQNRIRFSSKYEDSETGFYYYGFRYYDPETGRWPSRDPIGEMGGLNLYMMIGNNPLLSIDFLGLSEHRLELLRSGRRNQLRLWVDISWDEDCGSDGMTPSLNNVEYEDGYTGNMNSPNFAVVAPGVQWVVEFDYANDNPPDGDCPEGYEGSIKSQTIRATVDQVGYVTIGFGAGPISIGFGNIIEFSRNQIADGDYTIEVKCCKECS